jgi:hypothetical protein
VSGGALPGVLPEPPPPPRTRRMRVALWTIYGLFTAACLFAATALFSHWHGIAFSTIIGTVFLFFGVGKIALAIDAMQAPTAQAPRSDQRQQVGSPALFRLWVIYKMAPGIIGLGAGVWLIAFGSRMVDSMPYLK